ncbi:pyridoxal kinase family protein [Trichomonas vaginalis G3]|uniref:pyridoxal kinase n=1 Tax=Trichomonas vaginalis (strain ATCC PRA-98 / G3) TaxID=412133 RepID=A2G3I4_TRIV3|nr:pyridoxal 5'-phosphate salvage [Trichomonas vaginalis G3]EAX88287.1 pyridoxal kinase family protein [Trichomonas vaginalis G3]KAI5488698.1 pyridoxal 5'-phosphate salvage [Trichomonas vaginalis G3]|eukprot:XP_001301217.1 pyridoxal kinase family protein [Trichomonas vaginalis G3]
MTKPLVLSIQSGVSHGRCGNRSAVPAIEMSGIDCDPINTVNFSTNTAYPVVKGTKLHQDQLHDLLEGLRLNNILSEYTHMLTGYVGDPNIIKEFASLRKELGSNVCYFCDPVLGDNGRFYVSQECLELIKTVLVPVAQIISPNAYEAEWLTGLKMTNQAELLKIVSKLHELGPETVVITSTEWKRSFVFFSFEKGQIQFAIELVRFDRKFNGPGDLFAALFLANNIRFPKQYEKIASRTVNSVYGVLKTTVELDSRELAIPSSVSSILHPADDFKIIPLQDFMQITI